jgi:hypothetical protein
VAVDEGLAHRPEVGLEDLQLVAEASASASLGPIVASGAA